MNPDTALEEIKARIDDVLENWRLTDAEKEDFLDDLFDLIKKALRT